MEILIHEGLDLGIKVGSLSENLSLFGWSIPP
jgi:hypothetical protein